MFLIYLSLLLFISHEKSETQSYGILISGILRIRKYTETVASLCIKPSPSYHYLEPIYYYFTPSFSKFV